MNGKKGSIRIDFHLPPKAVAPEVEKNADANNIIESLSPRKWIWDVWEFAKRDTTRVTFSLKVGLACLLVSLLILFRAPYEVFGTNIIWSILTVAVMFEYTVGMHTIMFHLHILWWQLDFCMLIYCSIYT